MNMKKTIFFAAIFLVALTLTACVLGKKKEEGQGQPTAKISHSYTFEVGRDIAANEKDAYLKAIKKRLQVYGYNENTVEISEGKKIRLAITEVPGVIFLENEFLQYMVNTPTFEIRTEEEPAKLIVSAEEKAQLEKFNNDAKAKTQGLLEGILANPDTFAQVAKDNSEDVGSRDKGGTYTGIKKGQLVPEYEDVIFNKLKVGEIYPQLVATQYGWHIIKKDAERGEGETKEIDTSHILISKRTEQQILAAKQWLETGLTGVYIDKVNPVQQAENSFAFQILFDETGKQLLSQITKNNVNKPLAIFIDGVGIGTPTVQNEITNGELVITGDFTQENVTAIAQRLSSGAIQFPLSLVAPAAAQ